MKSKVQMSTLELFNVVPLCAKHEVRLWETEDGSCSHGALVMARSKG
jgi:hypothetical protein